MPVQGFDGLRRPRDLTGLGPHVEQAKDAFVAVAADEGQHACGRWSEGDLALHERRMLAAEGEEAAVVVEDRVGIVLLRRHGSARGMFRWTTRDVTVSDVTIPANSNVYLAFQASGHDEEHFPDPMRYDIDRPNAGEHLAFGRGRHFCLGAPLARLETTLAVRSLIERLPTIRVVPGQTLEYARVITGAILEHLVVEWD